MRRRFGQRNRAKDVSNFITRCQLDDLVPVVKSLDPVLERSKYVPRSHDKQLKDINYELQ